MDGRAQAGVDQWRCAVGQARCARGVILADSYRYRYDRWTMAALRETRSPPDTARGRHAAAAAGVCCDKKVDMRRSGDMEERATHRA